MSKFCSLVTCHLTDKDGNLINPYCPGALKYTAPIKHGYNQWSFTVEGYVAVYCEDQCITSPIPFCIKTPFCLCVPPCGYMNFELKSFNACAYTCKQIESQNLGQINIYLSIETLIYSKRISNTWSYQTECCCCMNGNVCMYNDKIYDSTLVKSNSCICYKDPVMYSDVQQYIAMADGIKRSFTSEDKVKGYGCSGILSPTNVSLYEVFVNGIMQPRSTYILKKDELTFVTEDVPSDGQTVTISFITFIDYDCKTFTASQCQYCAKSDGDKKIYHDHDAMPGYGCDKIPSPDETSFSQLYANGIMQPKSNYDLKKGMLKFNTEDAPEKDCMITLNAPTINYSSDGCYKEFDYPCTIY